LRSEPVRREEVRVYRRLIGDGNSPRLVTMPLGTYRLEERGKDRGQFFVGDPALWQPLMDEYTCEQCGARFLAYKLADNMVRLCSDKRGRTAAQQRAWREANPRQDYFRQYHRKRDERRAEARADRHCKHCGVPIEAARPTRRFCSDLCRIRAHHHRRREAADD
jgi:hypothetical protein